MAGPIHIPENFCERSAPEFRVNAGLIAARFWHLHRLGEYQSETVGWLSIRGAHAAMQWMTGQQPNPPGSSVPRLRTRFDLLDVMARTELCISDDIDRWESVSGNSPHGIWFAEVAEAEGARLAYNWSMRIREARPYGPLSPADHEAAQQHYREYFGQPDGHQQAA